jgi:hypothetical protein
MQCLRETPERKQLCAADSRSLQRELEALQTLAARTAYHVWREQQVCHVQHCRLNCAYSSMHTMKVSATRDSLPVIHSC